MRGVIASFTTRATRLLTEGIGRTSSGTDTQEAASSVSALVASGTPRWTKWRFLRKLLVTLIGAFMGAVDAARGEGLKGVGNE